MLKKIGIVVMLMVAGAGIALAATEKLDRFNGAYPVIWLSGAYIGPEKGTLRVDNDVTNKLAAVKTCDLQNVDLPAAAAGVQSNVTATCGGMALGDVIVGIAPQQDDAAWDEGTLSGFVESANTIKLSYQADTTGGDPAATNDYFVTFIKRKLP